jgi:asparagine synthase (glutamine-hydrolysing)
VLPRSVVERRKVPYPSTQDPAYERALKTAVASLLDGGDFPAAPLIDVGKVRVMLDQPVGAVSLQGARTSLESLLQIDAWLKRYDVQVTI